MTNRIIDLLFKLNISSEDTLVKYSDKVRDRNDVHALKCTKSGVIVLDNTSFGKPEIYTQKNDFDYWSKTMEGADIESHINQDDIRRSEEILEFVENKNWLDFGTGMGGCLRLLKKKAKSASGLELQKAPREFLNKLGIKCYQNLSEIDDHSLDAVTLFHVFEHLDDPINTLREIHSKMKPGANLVIEVPHAKDALLTIFENNAFKDFTLWSEHLILHTKDSLRAFLEEAGFEVSSIKSIQRYPLSNHMHWLANNKPGGHARWAFMNNSALHDAYGAMLAQIDATDTITAYCKKK